MILLMTDDIPLSPCPCESGLPYNLCCGVPGKMAVNAQIHAYIGSEGIKTGHDLTPEMLAAVETISTNPDLFPARFQLLNNKVWFVKMSPEWYRQSVFLDPSRIKGTYVIEADTQWVATACQSLRWQSTSVIFHTAFCGSTLMAQALDSMFNCLSLKEPDALGILLYYLRNAPPEHPRAENFDLMMKLLSRRYDAQQGVVIKANDYANPIIKDLLSWEHAVPILFMYTPLEEFLAGCLKADNRREWIRGRYQTINTELLACFPTLATSDMNESDFGKMAAVYWCYNVSLFLKALHEVNKDSGKSHLLRSLDFNTMLASPRQAVQACGDLFGLKKLADTDWDETLKSLFGVYSKNNRFRYSPQQRELDISQVLNENPEHVEAAQQLARVLLGSDYPDTGLPAALI